MYKLYLGFLDDTLVHIKIYPLSTSYRPLIFELIDFFGFPNSIPITKVSSQKTLGWISSVDATIEKSNALKPVDVDDYFIKRNFSKYDIKTLPSFISFYPDGSKDNNIRPSIPEKIIYSFYRESFEAQWENEIIISYFGTRNPPTDAVGQFFWNCNIDYYSNSKKKNIIEKLIKERNSLKAKKNENENDKLNQLKEYF